jgi:hypothetical protein
MHKSTLTLPACGWVPPSPVSRARGFAPEPLARLREREGPAAKRWEGALDFEDNSWI